MSEMARKNAKYEVIDEDKITLKFETKPQTPGELGIISRSVFTYLEKAEGGCGAEGLRARGEDERLW